MARKRLPMRKTSEVLRLKHEDWPHQPRDRRSLGLLFLNTWARQANQDLPDDNYSRFCRWWYS